jgi:hypothetical protein
VVFWIKRLLIATAEAEGDSLTIETAELTAQVKAAKKPWWR